METVQHKAPAQRLTQLMPFNEFRFDDCMAFLSVKHGRELNKYEMMKLHVMIDVHHTIMRGKPVIGGKLSPYTNGPVARIAWARVKTWINQYDRRGVFPDGFLVKEGENGHTLRALQSPDQEDFSSAELQAMEKAWDDVIGRLQREKFQGSQDFFHGETAIGRAWLSAKHRGDFLDWNEIIDNYEKDGADLSHVKAMLYV